jgi:hypothetical protein
MTTQTIRLNGQRVRLVTKQGKVTATKALPLEWELQAAQCRALRALPQYARKAEDAGRGKFTLAGDMNQAKRRKEGNQQTIAKAAGMTAGEHDVRLYMWPEWSDTGGVLGLIENKVGKAKLEPSQEARHPLLAALGFTRQAVVRATSEEDAAAQAVALVCGWLAANENNGKEATKARLTD